MSPRELLSLTVMVVLMPWLSDMDIEVRGTTPGESHPREALGACFL